MNAIWKKTLKRFKRFAKAEEDAKINKAMIEIANNNFNLGVNEDNIEVVLEVVHEELTN